MGASPELQSRPALGLQTIVEIIGLTTLITAWLFAVGWSFAYAYFELWRMPMTALSLDLDHLVYYGFDAARRHWVWASLGLAVGLVLMAATPWAMRWLGVRAMIAVCTLAVGAAFAGGGYLGVYAANAIHADMRAVSYKNLPVVVLDMAPDWLRSDLPAGASDDETFLAARAAHLRKEAAAQDCHRMVFLDPDTLWTVRAHRENSDGSPSGEEIAVAAIPRDQIRAMRLKTPGPGNCP